MCGVHRLISEYAINREVLLRFETTFLVRQFMQHLRAYGCGVCAKKILHGFLLFKNTPISNRAETSTLVGLLHYLEEYDRS